jgi:hypothetical protein
MVQVQLIDLREIQPTDSVELIKLKKKFNAIATSLNSLSQKGMPSSKQKLLELIHELYLAGKEINEYK